MSRDLKVEIVGGAGRRLFHASKRVYGEPWAILPSKLAAICAFIERARAGVALSAEDLETLKAASPRAAAGQVGSVGVVPIFGTITPRADLFSEFSGGTSLESFLPMFQNAVDDSSIGAIVLNIDSPGGAVNLMPEAAAQIRAARGSKPIVAVVNNVAASAAYWLAAQADEVVSTPSGMIGSIGVHTAHDDLSGALEQEGVKVTLISAGAYKTEGNPYEPLTPEARQAIQDRVDDFYSMFVADVNAGRGAGTVNFEQGSRVLTTGDAMKAGLVDRVATYEQTVGRLLGAQTPATAFVLMNGTMNGSSSTSTLRADGYEPVQYRKEPDETRQCPECDSYNAEDARYCDQCGSALPGGQQEPYEQEADETIECPGCGAMNEPDARYCDQCGTRLEGRTDITSSAQDLDVDAALYEPEVVEAFLSTASTREETS